MTDLDQGQWAAGLTTNDAVIIDVRTPEEWEEGIIPGAKLLNIFDAHAFMAGISEMDKTRGYYVYCRSGGRSGQACQIMETQGFKNVFNLNGGFSEWQGAKTDAPTL
jgi:rhodanese-related sulfurtransferase